VGIASDDEKAPEAGAVVVYKRYENIWVTHQKFTYPNIVSYSGFGVSVGLDGNTKRFVAGAPGVPLSFFGKIK
jgi:hypothetical protein